MNSNNLTLKPVLAGYGGNMIVSAIFIAVFLVLVSITGGWLDAKVVEEGGTDFFEAWEQTRYEQTTLALYALLWWGMWFLAFVSFCCLVGNIYNLHSVTTVQARGKVTLQSYSFPFSQTHTSRDFNRVVGIGVNQTSWDRIFNTGTICLKCMVHTNADADIFNWYIRGIPDPEKAAESIESIFPVEEATKIKIVESE